MRRRKEPVFFSRPITATVYHKTVWSSTEHEIFWQRICKDGWAYRKFSDGVCQWCPPYETGHKDLPSAYVERVHPSRVWNVVDRSDPSNSRRTDPPVISGPYKTLRAAKTAMKINQAVGR